MIKVLLIPIVISIICPIINYGYLFLSTKFKFHKEFVKFLLDDISNEDYFFIVPVYSWIITPPIITYLLYRLLLRPFFYLVIMLPLKGFKWVSEILFRPIKKMRFIDEVNTFKEKN